MFDRLDREWEALVTPDDDRDRDGRDGGDAARPNPFWIWLEGAMRARHIEGVQALADCARLGRTTVNGWRLGQAMPTLATARQLAACLHVSVLVILWHSGQLIESDLTVVRHPATGQPFVVGADDPTGERAGALPIPPPRVGDAAPPPNVEVLVERTKLYLDATATAGLISREAAWELIGLLEAQVTAREIVKRLEAMRPDAKPSE